MKVRQLNSGFLSREPKTLLKSLNNPCPKPQITRGRCAILAVDDDGLVLMNTALMLQDLGHTVIEATAGADALDILRNENVDLVISDHAMPRTTGSQLALAIHAESGRRCRSSSATGFAEISEGCGIIDIPRLGKPLLQAQLAEAISRIAQ